MSATIAAVDQVRAAEDRRCRALVEDDLSTLARLVRDDIVHVHATGAIDDKTQYLAGLTSRIRFERADRKDLTVRVFGDTAIATGMLEQTIVNRASGNRVEGTFTTTQVWVCEDDAWSQASFHASRPPPAGPQATRAE